MKKMAYIIATFVFSIMIGLISLIFANQRKYMWVPGRKLNENEAKIYKTEEKLPDGTHMEYIFIPKNSDIDIIYLSGNCVWEKEILSISKKFASLTGANVYAPFYSGINNDHKEPTQKNLEYDLDNLAKILNSKNTKKIIFGFSLGSSFALRLAQKISNLRYIFLMNPITNIKNVVSEIVIVPFVKYFVLDNWDNMDLIQNLKAPCHFFISKDDELVKPSHSKILLKLAKNNPSFNIVEKAKHTDLWRESIFSKEIKPKILEVVNELKH